MTKQLTTWQLVRKIGIGMSLQTLGIVFLLATIADRAWGWLILEVPGNICLTIGLFFDLHDWKAPRR